VRLFKSDLLFIDKVLLVIIHKDNKKTKGRKIE